MIYSRRVKIVIIYDLFIGLGFITRGEAGVSGTVHVLGLFAIWYYGIQSQW